MVQALGLISGGLDSILALLLLRRAGVDARGLTLVTPFFDADKALEAAEIYDFELTVLEVGPEHLEQVVKNPRYGYGSNMNPCIDCHAYMLRKAGHIMDEQGYDFLFTGEVLGQRPMSQNANALKAVAKASGYGPKVLRPLSAGTLPITAMEESGLVDRAQLAAISGRGRKPQMRLAQELGVTRFPSPGGGCLLTDPGFSRRLRDLLNFSPQADTRYVELLKVGRHFRLADDAKLIVGRNQAENQRLEELAAPDSVYMKLADRPGPLGLYYGPEKRLPLAASIVAAYGQPDVMIRVTANGTVLEVEPFSKFKTQEYIL